MHQLDKRPYYQGLRFKLLAVSLTLLVIPWAGYRYLAETESFLRAAQEQLLLGRAEMVANILRPQANSFFQQNNPPAGRPQSNILYAHPIDHPIHLDGYAEEWLTFLSQSRHFRASEINPDAVAFELLLAVHTDSLYLLIQVTDRDILYTNSDSKPASGDHLLIAVPGRGNRAQQFVIGTSAPGWVVASSLTGGTPLSSVRGEWQETDQGYNIELRLPLKLAAGFISLAIVDKDHPHDKEIAGISATSGLKNKDNLSLILIPSTEINRLLEQTAKESLRVRIINQQRLVIAQQGKLIPTDNSHSNGIFQRMMNLIVPFMQEDFRDKRENLGRLDGPEIRSALKDRPASYRHHDRDSGITTLSAAYPIQDVGITTGAVIVEQTTDEVLAIHQRSLERLLGISLVLFLITGTSLLFFASHLTGRIMRLRDKVNNAVSGDGRISRNIDPDSHQDEIGDLEQSFASVMDRLLAYNRYLEAMASRLAHEFRTPLVMVKSSLENLKQDDDPAAQGRYLSRAAEGIQRLSLILERMREASRLEQTLQMADLESVNLVDLVKAMCDNYAAAYNDTDFECHIPDQAIFISAAPELIVQALDKLISNAIDFHCKGTAIVIELVSPQPDSCSLNVVNHGAKLPAGMELQLFDSMVSVREKPQKQPHLGLGLYLVRLIVEFHHGTCCAVNTADGVCFSIRLPLSQS